MREGRKGPPTVLLRQWTNPPSQSTSTTVSDARNSRIQQIDGLTNQVTTYDPDHNYAPQAVYLPTGSGRELQSLFTYDVRHRLTTISHQLCVVADVTSHACSSTTAAGSDMYAYDEVDSRTRVTEANGAATSDRFYCYDARDQLIYRNTAAACSSSAKDEAYTYDDAGNRTSALVAGSTRTFTYTPDGQLTACTVPACTITYDTTGRTSAWTDSGITWAYTYDSAGRLTSACKSTACTGSGFDRLDFAYDGEGHRTKITETPAAPTIQTPVITRDFRYQGDAVVEELVNTVSLRTIVVDEAGAPVKLTIAVGQPNAGTYLPTWSGHGDLLALWQVQADGSLVLANSVTYDTWGRPSVTSANGIPDLGWSRLYVGRSDVWWDNAFGAGLLYMHARSYSPTLGRFLQPDPIAAEGNLYGYAENSPVTKADASGTVCEFAILLGPEAVVVSCAAVAIVAGLAWVSSRIPSIVLQPHSCTLCWQSTTSSYRPTCYRGCTVSYFEGARRKDLQREIEGGGYRLRPGRGPHDVYVKPGSPNIVLPRGRNISPGVTRQIRELLRRFGK